MKTLAIAIVLGAALTCGCGDKGGSTDSKSSSSSESKGDDKNADVEAFVKLDSEKGEAFAAGGDDCEAKAKSVGDWRTKHTAEYKALQKKLDAQWKGGPPKEVNDKHGEKLKANKKAVMDAMAKCTGNDAFDKMMEKTKTE